MSFADVNPCERAACIDSVLGVTWNIRCSDFTASLEGVSSAGRFFAEFVMKAFNGVRPRLYPRVDAVRRNFATLAVVFGSIANSLFSAMRAATRVGKLIRTLRARSAE